ncbi:MAG: hypothetical protein FWF29_08450, partial [Treponema sp.]|nr:hypothetical protein [Treponema sp.]
SPERLPRQSLAGEVSGSGRGRKMINGSAVTVTASAGMILASLVIRDVVSRYAPQEGVLRREFFCGEGGYGHG